MRKFLWWYAALGTIASILSLAHIIFQTFSIGPNYAVQFLLDFYSEFLESALGWLDQPMRGIAGIVGRYLQIPLHLDQGWKHVLVITSAISMAISRSVFSGLPRLQSTVLNILSQLLALFFSAWAGLTGVDSRPGENLTAAIDGFLLFERLAADRFGWDFPSFQYYPAVIIYPALCAATILAIGVIVKDDIRLWRKILAIPTYCLAFSIYSIPFALGAYAASYYILKHFGVSESALSNSGVPAMLGGTVAISGYGVVYGLIKAREDSKENLNRFYLFDIIESYFDEIRANYYVRRLGETPEFQEELKIHRESREMLLELILDDANTIITALKANSYFTFGIILLSILVGTFIFVLVNAGLS